MDNQFFERPVLNSPYAQPMRHWELDGQGQPTQRIIEGRRRAEFITPIINELRHYVGQWRSIPNPADWQVTHETARLLRHWRHYQFNNVRPFFCQVEAVETVIWLTEVAPNLGERGNRFLKHLANANNDANPGLMRLALKLATGAGKTTVMAMLIAWQTINAVRRPQSKKYTRGFLIVTPGLTIKDRLRVLQPNDPDGYYESRELVPGDMLDDVKRAKIVITNYHAFKLRERVELSKGGRSLLRGRGEALNTLETEGQMLQRVTPDLMGIKNIMALNDEAHHCYREKPGEDDVNELKGDDKEEAKKNNEAARLWISGLETVNRKLGLTRVIDLSATPFFLRGSGYAEGTLFPWTMSDFSLMDAIECGIVKLPRVPVADNISDGEAPKFRKLWEHIRSRMPKKGRGRSNSLDPLSLPVELQTALQALYGHYERTYRLWAEAGIRVPPCFIVVCNNTSSSKLVYDYISGFQRENDDGTSSLENGRLPLFRNFDEHGAPLGRPCALLIDSEQLESGGALDDNFRALAAGEIDRFRREITERAGARRRAENLTDQDLLREVMNTVGKPGQLGESIRCVISVSMITEGWDCLDSETEILTPGGWRGRGEIAPGDIVYSLNRDTRLLETVPVLEYGERPVRSDERMVRLKSQHLDIRVTEGHEFHIKYRDPRKGGALSQNFITKTGAELLERHSSYALPLSASYHEEVTNAGKMVYRVSVRDAQWITSDPSDERATRITAETPHPGELVWCIRNRNSSIVTRRNGKIAILGNCNSVTHVLGVRAFGTQLLCEQVIGRALRRQSYELNEDGLFNVEYADALGIPFDFTAKPVVAPPQKPLESIQVKAVRPDRDHLEIRFPRVAGYRVELPDERLTGEFNDDSVLVLTPDLVGHSTTRNAGIIGEAVNLNLERLDDMRPSTLLFHLTQRLLYTKWRDSNEEAKLYLFGQLKRITRQWLDTCLVCKGGAHPAQLMYRELADMACERITTGITRALAPERPIKAVLDPYNPTGSTIHVRFNTSKTGRWETDARRCHINWVILESDWEAEFCRVAESHPRVRAYVKNHNLGLEVPYRYGSETRKYIPDFIALVDDGHGADDPLRLIVEIKGYRREDAKEKKATMDNYWVPGVNNNGQYGRWAFAELADVYLIESDFAAKVEAGLDGLIGAGTMKSSDSISQPRSGF